jgi:hypothetical protein
MKDYIFRIEKETPSGDTKKIVVELDGNSPDGSDMFLVKQFDGNKENSLSLFSEELQDLYEMIGYAMRHQARNFLENN